jgi:hypothetical protein
VFLAVQTALPGGSSAIEALHAAFQDRYASLKQTYEQRLHSLVTQVL